MNLLTAYSGQQAVGSWGWRHALAWQQLSVIWGLQVRQVFSDHLPDSPVSASAYTLAMAPGEFASLARLDRYFAAAPVVVFLNRVSLRVHERLNIEMEEDQTPPGSFKHIFQVDTEGPLTMGLPRRLVTFGPLVDITPLPVEPGLQILVRLDGMPIIGCRLPHLFIGADAWQLGNPSVPLVYPILKNWLGSVVGCEFCFDAPRAMIRVDDLPITAYELLRRQPTPTLDRQRAATIRRLRNFSLRTGTCMSLMYTSHYYVADGNTLPIGLAMPLSIREMRLGVEQCVFEIGAHGMLHLRYERAVALQDDDPREFMDLDEVATITHLGACVEEIRRLFDVAPASFVAPAWGYRPGLTKMIAGRQFRVVIDSSQHIEDGSVTVFSMPDDESPAFNCTETFRPGSRMLSYSSVEFWKCYALAGIPVHYMQHTDTNWHLLHSFIGDQVLQASLPAGQIDARLIEYMQNAAKPRLVRALVAAWLLLTCLRRQPSSFEYLLKLLTDSSLYATINAMRKAGYRFVGLAQFAEVRQGSGH